MTKQRRAVAMTHCPNCGARIVPTPKELRRWRLSQRCVYRVPGERKTLAERDRDRALLEVNPAMKPRQAAAPSRIMTVAGVARYLQIHPATLYRLLRRHQIPAFKIGSDYRFDRDAVVKWMADGQVKG
jgi:excisionase family DNA binding protein